MTYRSSPSSRFFSAIAHPTDYRRIRTPKPLTFDFARQKINPALKSAENTAQDRLKRA
jgi:hypothetical protein